METDAFLTKRIYRFVGVFVLLLKFSDFQRAFPVYHSSHAHTHTHKYNLIHNITQTHSLNTFIHIIKKWYMVKCVEEKIIITQLSLVAFHFSLFFSLYIVMSFSLISHFICECMTACVYVILYFIVACFFISCCFFFCWLVKMSVFESMFNLPEFSLTSTSFFYYFRYNNKSLFHEWSIKKSLTHTPEHQTDREKNVNTMKKKIRVIRFGIEWQR